MDEKIINHEEYVEKLPKTVKMVDKTFEYNLGQIFYKNNIIT
jgi:hypothetical protein